MVSAPNSQGYKHLDYQLGYTYFKLKDYNSAASYFKNFTEKNGNPQMTVDAYARLGDSYFVTSRYWPASA